MVCAGHHICGLSELPELPEPPPLFLPIVLRTKQCPKAPSQQSGCTQGPESGNILNHGGKNLDSFFCLITLSNHFLLLLGFPHFLSLSPRRMFEVCRAPTSALNVPSGRGHAECVTPGPVKHSCTFCRSGLLGLCLQSDLQQPRQRDSPAFTRCCCTLGTAVAVQAEQQCPV